MLKGLIFDFDGLILDTETPIYHAWQRVYESYKVELPFNMWVSYIGTSEHYFEPITYLRSQCGHQIMDHDVLDKYQSGFEELILEQKIMPGIIELIQSAENFGLKIAIASSSPISWVTRFTKSLGIHNYFDCFATRDEVKRTKPHPDLYLLALSKLGINAREAAAFEDSLHGMTAANSANIFSIAVPANLTKHQDFSAASLIIKSAAEIDLNQLKIQHFS